MCRKKNRMKKILFLSTLVVIIIFLGAFKKVTTGNQKISNNDTLLFEGEKHFANMQQLTFGGDNAEAYFSFDGKYIIFQKTNPAEGINCDQIYVGKVPAPGEKFEYKRISNGKGRTTCGAFLKDGKHVVFASTHLDADNCPPVPDRTKYGNKYIWPLYSSYDIFMADLDGNIVKQLFIFKMQGCFNIPQPGI